MISNKEMAILIAEEVKKISGTAYYVGGYVRNSLINADNLIEDLDIDIEVHGVDEHQLNNIISKFSTPMSYGKSFGITSLEDYHLDIALPRSEIKIGDKHTDFDIYIDKNLGTYEAARRRDFTINSIMQDILTGELIDHFGGIEDIKNKTIRHIDDKRFSEDPLRVLRAAQFASRFDFKVHPSTMKLCSQLDITNLSSERILLELKKALLQAQYPSIFFDTLDKMGHLDYWFKEIKNLQAVEQSKIFHKEGNAYIHTMMVLDEAVEYRDRVDNPFYFMMAALCHDIGKAVTTTIENGKIRSINHEIIGQDIAEVFIKRISNEKGLIKYVRNMIELHMRPNICKRDNSKIKSTNKLFYQSLAPQDLIYLAQVDNLGRIGYRDFDSSEEFLFERLEIFNETMSKPYVSGKDLIENGIEPGEIFKEILEYATKLRLARIDKENALKQTLMYAKKLKKEEV